MKIKASVLTAAICLACSPAFAASADVQNNSKSPKNSTASTASQLDSLEQQVKTLEAQVKQSKSSQQNDDIEKQIEALEAQIELIKNKAPLMPYIFGSSVLVTPHLGEKAQFDASDLTTNIPDINEDMMFLQARQKREDFLTSVGVTPVDHPLLVLSGYVEGKVFDYKDYNKTEHSDIDLSGAELKVLAEVSPWATAYIDFTYDDSDPEFGYRADNSNVSISRAFLTVGNLNKFPVYASIGQMYVPFGAYDSYMITDTLTKTMAKTKERPLLVGFNKDGAYGSVYGYKGDSYTGSGNTINSWGANLGYNIKFQQVSFDVGAGYIANLADSMGMQETYADNGFQGFGEDNSGSGMKDSEQLTHQVPGLDLHAELGYGHWSLIGEYIAALRSFDQNDLSFNGSGAQVSAMDAEGAYNFHFYDRPVTFAVGYQQSWEALGLNIPEQVIVGTAAISIWKDTIEKIEYRHDINYSADDYAGGSDSDVTNPDGSRNRNSVIAQIDFYF